MREVIKQRELVVGLTSAWSKLNVQRDLSPCLSNQAEALPWS